MIQIPSIKIPSVRVGSIGPASNIGTGGATPAPPTPITYLTQWRMMGNSTVHTDEYLTSWKVEGNSVVDNNAILSCGDLGQDGKYHVKISNGVTIYDIPLTEPLRKVNDVADKIEFADGVAVLTRYCASDDMGNLNYTYRSDLANPVFQAQINERAVGRTNILSSLYIVSSASAPANLNNMETMGHWSVSVIYFRNDAYTNSTDFKNAMRGVELIYELATPTTEVIQASPFPISATDAYTSANDTPYSAFEYKKNVEIWSCGEYNPIDGKYHILVQPLGGSIADIALDEPLRKVNNVADSIEFADGAATLTRNYKRVDWDTANVNKTSNNYFSISELALKYGTMNLLSNLYPVYSKNTSVVNFGDLGIGSGGNESFSVLRVVNKSMNDLTAPEFTAANAAAGIEIIYELATPTTEVIQVPQIQEADSYSMVISQGAKAVEWSSFTTDNE